MRRSTGGAGWFDGALTFTGTEFREMEELLGASLDDEKRGTIIHHCITLAVAFGRSDQPVDAVLEHLADGQRHIGAALRVLRSIPNLPNQQDEWAISQSKAWRDFVSGEGPSDTIRVLEGAEDAYRTAYQNCFDASWQDSRTGPKPDSALDHFLLGLIQVARDAGITPTAHWNDAEGRRNSPLVRFVNRVSRSLELRLEENSEAASRLRNPLESQISRLIEREKPGDQQSSK